MLQKMDYGFIMHTLDLLDVSLFALQEDSSSVAPLLDLLTKHVSFLQLVKPLEGDLWSEIVNNASPPHIKPTWKLGSFVV